MFRTHASILFTFALLGSAFGDGQMQQIQRTHLMRKHRDGAAQSSSLSLSLSENQSSSPLVGAKLAVPSLMNSSSVPWASLVQSSRASQSSSLYVNQSFSLGISDEGAVGSSRSLLAKRAGDASRVKEPWDTLTTSSDSGQNYRWECEWGQYQNGQGMRGNNKLNSGGWAQTNLNIANLESPTKDISTECAKVCINMGSSCKGFDVTTASVSNQCRLAKTNVIRVRDDNNPRWFCGKMPKGN